jgi:release factor glutamine methyltransferase
VTARAALARAADRLAAQAVPDAGVDAEWLLAHVLGCSRSELHAGGERELTGEELTAFEALVERRSRREPLAYVLGEWGFRRLTIKVDRRALVPRPETEAVVERCLALLAPFEAPRVLDLGVGSGAIALAIADEHPGASVTGVDTSPGALALARENAAASGLAVELREAGIEAAAEGWDLVVSNPPYVDPEEIDALEPEVRDWEPRSALVGTGLHGEIARAARTSWLVFEVGDGQAEEVAATLADAGYGDVRISDDLAGRRRVVEGRRA